MFLEKDNKKSESTDDIAGRIIEKMKKNKEEASLETETETKTEVKTESDAVDEEIKNLEKVKDLIDEKINL
jgi:hypothetical protein